MTLYELNQLVREVIEETLYDEYWVEAELAEVREVRGHCYMELVEFPSNTNSDSRSVTPSRTNASRTPIARASARCWQSSWILIRPHFERVTGQPLSPGMKVLLKVYPQFHEAYGFSWIVTDIDPTFTLGDMARRRQEIIRQLKEEGVYDLQKSLTLPVFCQRIAVISSVNAAGYGDFVNQLTNNDYGFRFETTLFPATMQGDNVEPSIIEALNKINSYLIAGDQGLSTGEQGTAAGSPFDCVVIIRGGGATTDLSGFDTLSLAENVANFPLPIITGIGHERDESVLDLVAHTSVKTPTAVAAFLIDHLSKLYDFLVASQETIARCVRQQMEKERLRLNRWQTQIPALFSVYATRQEARIEQLRSRLTPALNNLLQREVHRLQLLEQRATSLDPTLLLQRGYSITLVNGKSLRDPADVKPGDEITTRLEKGTIKSKVL